MTVPPHCEPPETTALSTDEQRIMRKALLRSSRIIAPVTPAAEVDALRARVAELQEEIATLRAALRSTGRTYSGIVPQALNGDTAP